MPSYDVIVAGLGGMGSAAAYRLAQRGLRVLGLERYTPVHDKGSSHGGSRITRQAYFEDPAYVPLLLRAAELWPEVEAASGRTIVHLTGGVMVGRADSRTVAGSLRSAQEWGLPHELLDAAEIRRRFPTMTPAPDEVALYERGAGLVIPEESVAAHLALASGSGAELHFGEPVTGWQATGGGGVRVSTAAATYPRASWWPAPGRGPRGCWPAWACRSAWNGRCSTGSHQWPARNGSARNATPSTSGKLTAAASSTASRRSPDPAGGPPGGVKVAFFRGGQPCTPATIERTVRPEEIGAMRAFVAPRMPDLPGTFLKAVTCMYTNTPDEHFVIARHPGHEQVIVACGFSGHGFKFVPVVGEILADLAADGGTSHPIALFDPRRLMTSPRPPGTALIRNRADQEPAHQEPAQEP